MITADEALELAAREIGQGPVLADPLFAPWRSAHLGEPVLVSTVWKQPSYWLVPVELGDRAIGYVRVLGSGRASAIGANYTDPTHINAAPATVTRIDSAEAANRAATQIDSAAGETAQSPLFVHDGPPGREAWLVEVEKGGRPVRWLFVTSGGVYDRPAGSTQEEGLE